MNKLNGDELIQQIAIIAIVYKDEELKEHFTFESVKVLRKCADRIEKAYKEKE